MLRLDDPCFPAASPGPKAPPRAMLDRWSARLGHHTGPLDFWQHFGLGRRGDGLLEVPDPEWLAPTLDAWLGGPSAGRTPLAYTGLGDILYFRDLSERARELGLDEATIHAACDVSLLNTRYKRVDVLSHSMQDFLARSSKADEMRELFEQPLFAAGLTHAGPLGPRQILGYVPALSLGGSPDASQLQALDAQVHWSILLQS